MFYICFVRLTDMLYFWSNEHLHTIYIYLNIVDGVIMVKLTYHPGIEMPFSDCISLLISDISRLMQSENGISIHVYISVDLCNWHFHLCYPQVLVDKTQHPPFFIFFLFYFFIHFHGLEICKPAIICRFLIA
jgi:hypothetical protein